MDLLGRLLRVVLTHHSVGAHGRYAGGGDRR